VVTHDRWFLDAACTETWEVVDGAVHRYDGGYAAFVLARAERERTTALASEKRDNLLRKELAWLRRGAPARTSKPRFRIDAAEALIADEPPPRDRLELERFATARLGRQVYDLEHVSIAPAVGAPRCSRPDLATRPGDRIGLLGPNGAGKTTLLRLLAAGRDADHRSEHVDTHGVDVRQGQVEVGRTVVVGHLAQIVEPVDPDDRVLPSVSRVKTSVEVGRGRTLTALSLLEGFGFTGDRLQARLGDLSGGESRRLALLMLLLEGPNVLLLDEPTNDLDVETLTVVEDLLDGWPGTVVVVSHDRYFLERTTDAVYAMLGDGRLRHLPGGVEEYLRRRADAASAPAPGAGAGARTRRRPDVPRAPQAPRSRRAGAGDAARSSAARAAAGEDHGRGARSRRHGRPRHRPRAGARARCRPARPGRRARRPRGPLARPRLRPRA
jgi:ATP-binding cassette subfamily F protein uup